MRNRYSIYCLAILALCLIPTSMNVFGDYQIPFEGMRLVYYTQTTQALLQQAGLAARGWITLTFHDLSMNSSKMDVNVNATVTESGNTLPENLSTTTQFPTDRDTLLFLRNGGQQNLEIYAGAAGQAIQVIPGFSFQIPRTWELHDQAIAKTTIGTFSVYRYHTSLGSGSTMLDFYASYDKLRQLLVYGETYATEGGASVLVETLELRDTNVQFSTPQSQSSQCVIATAAYGSELAGPVQFLRNFRDIDVDRTFLGHSFLSAFNAWYYSWAPSIAKLESGNAALRAAARTAIVPLLGTLYVSSILFGQLHFAPEVAILISGIMASSMLGAIYLTPITLTVLHWRRKHIGRSTVAMLILFGLFLTLAGTLGHGTTGIIENLTSLTVVESALLSTALVAYGIQAINGAR
ncbi:MAG TPA: CFI-box-CTERM domain-containing protein [Methylomirabilota bacterium]|nr:CFI-box-CTERM domain-containing protein [Methylomirabilota bacterium]